MDSTTAADILRIANLVLAGGSYAIGSVVVVNYVRAYVGYRRAQAAGAGLPPWRGLLPRHVAVIGASHLGLIGVTMVGVFGRIHEPLTWHGPVLFIFYGLSLWALWDMIGAQRYRRVPNPGALTHH